MQVKFISVTKPDDPTLTPEGLIAYCARVSSPKQDENADIDKLIGYCIRNGHWSIFEMVDMTLEIVTSRAISAQIIRHKSFSYQEFSTRYAEVMGYEPCEARRQDEKNRQNSIDDLSEDEKDWFLDAQHEIWLRGYDRYKEALARGIAKECARMVLPLNTQTRLYMKGSVRSWIHYLQVRIHPSTQLEHRQVAIAAMPIFNNNFPIVSAALDWSVQ
jgi:thymidylate synthase (FAD)